MVNSNEKRRIAVVGRGGASNIDWEDIENKPDFATVATSGSYNDLTDKPEIPGQVNADWDATSGVAQILNKPTLATVATSGSYNDLSDKPTIPAAPVQSDWNETDSSSLAYITNKPTIPAAQVQSDWNQTDTTAVDYIKNKPEIPSVPAMATQELTFTLQGGTTKTFEFYTAPNYFYVEDVSGNTNILSITKSYSSAPSIEVFYSTDRINWTSMGTTSTTAITATIPINGKLYLKANASTWTNYNLAYHSVNAYNRISSSNGNLNVGGNIMSLLYGDDFDGKISQSIAMFAYLFANTGIIKANKLLLPSTRLGESAYHFMFSGCTSLTAAPALPATILNDYCYKYMFSGCTSLTAAPALPATTLAIGCYQGMFNGCTNLNKVTTYATDISATNCLNNWLNNVAATGDFYNLGGVTYTSGASGIPTGWTVHTSL